MSKNTYIAIGALVVVLALVAVVIMQKNAGPTDPGIDSSANVSGSDTGSSIDTFSGTISEVDTGCLADGVCSVTVDGRKVVLVEAGGQAVPPGTPVGKLVGVNSVGELSQKIGAFANVYAGKTADGNYSIYGNSDFYVEIVPIGDK
jgi:hypothetical protein